MAFYGFGVIYNASSSNCQDFCVGLLKANGVNDIGVISFIKQDTKAVFEGHSGLRKFANSLTDLAGND